MTVITTVMSITMITDITMPDLAKSPMVK